MRQRMARRGTRASFSNTGSHLSLAAPGEGVLGALSAQSSSRMYPRFALPGSGAGLYGYSSGTSFAAPQVAGAAALVWAAKPTATASEVADILERTASGRGSWTPSLGYGIVDVAGAVADALGTTAADARPSLPAKAALRLRIERATTGFQLSARLRSLMPAISPAGRLVRLEARRGGRWQPLATARTDGAGRVRWRVGSPLPRQLRVRYVGANDLASASSRFVHVPARPAPARGHGHH